MHTMVKRSMSAAAALAAVAGGLLVSAAPASAADGTLVYIVNNENPTVATGNNLNTIQVKASAACNALATRHVLKVVGITPTNPADQPDVDKWLASPNFYAPNGTNLPGPLTVFASETFQVFADRIGAKIVPGQWNLELRCQNNLGTTVYDRFTGSFTMNSATAWTGFLPQTGVATTTTVAASPNPATAGQNVTLTATVAETDAAAPSGSVEFFDGATSLGTGAVNASGQATLLKSFAAGTHAVKAKYLGDSAFRASESAATDLVVNAAPAAATSTSLTVAPLSGAAYQNVTFSGAVANTATASVVPTGSVELYDGVQKVATVPCDAAGAYTYTAATFGAGDHSFKAKFVPAGNFTTSESAVVAATYDAPTATPDEQTIVVTVPAGNLSIFTPYTPANPLDLGEMVLAANGSSYSASAPFNKVTVTDTRAGNPGWTASLLRADFVGANPADTIPAKFSGFEGVQAQYLANNAITNIAVNDVPAGTAVSGPAAFATAAAGQGTGSVDVVGNFVLEGVPTSTKAGLYTTTVTFTVG